GFRWRDPATLQLLHSSRRLLPLAPDYGAQLPSQPRVEFLKRRLHLRFAEVCPPSYEYRLQQSDCVGEGATAPSSQDGLKLVLESLRRRRGHLQLHRPFARDRIPEELSLPGPGHRALVPIDRQPQSFAQKALEGGHHALARFLRLHVHVAVVGIADERVPPS